MEKIKKLKELLDKLPYGLIGSFDGQDLWKYEANEGSIDSEDYLDLKLGDVWFNTTAITPFKDIETLLDPRNDIKINLDLLLEL